MERFSRSSGAFLSSAEGTEVLGGLGDNVRTQRHLDAARRRATDGHVEEDNRVAHDVILPGSEAEVWMGCGWKCEGGGVAGRAVGEGGLQVCGAGDQGGGRGLHSRGAALHPEPFQR